MKFNFLLVSLLILYTISSCTEEILKTTEADDQLSLQASHNEETYTLDIVLPANYHNSTKKYPIIYQLDGNYQTDLVADILSEEGNNLEAIVVGIGYEELTVEKRFRDMTHPIDPDIDHSGQADQFYEYLTQTILPTVENKYRVDQQKRILSGHSLGGYFSLWTLFRESNSTAYFSGFIAASPSCQYNNAIIFALEKEFSTNENGKEKKIYLGVGEREFPHLNLYFDEMIERLKAKESESFSVEGLRYKNLLHSETKQPIYKDGLQFLFNN